MTSGQILQVCWILMDFKRKPVNSYDFNTYLLPECTGQSRMLCHFVQKVVKLLEIKASVFWWPCTNHWISLNTITGVFSAVVRNWSCVIPVGWAVGSRAGATHRGRRQEIQSEHHRAVIPLEDEVRRRAARPDSDDILQSHAVQQKGSL